MPFFTCSELQALPDVETPVLPLVLIVFLFLFSSVFLLVFFSVELLLCRCLCLCGWLSAVKTCRMTSSDSSRASAITSVNASVHSQSQITRGQFVKLRNSKKDDRVQMYILYVIMCIRKNADAVSTSRCVLLVK